MMRESGAPQFSKSAAEQAAALAAAAAGAHFVLPPEACQAVIEAQAGQLLRVCMRAEDAPEPPAWADSAADLKELCSNYRRAAAAAAAAAGLAAWRPRRRPGRAAHARAAAGCWRRRC
jgi:hypothetical protein